MSEPPKRTRDDSDDALGVRTAGGAGAPAPPVRAPPVRRNLDTYRLMLWARRYRLVEEDESGSSSDDDEDDEEVEYPLLDWLSLKDQAELAQALNPGWVWAPGNNPPPSAPSDTLLYMVRRAYRLEDGSEWQPLMEWLTLADKCALSESCRTWWTYVPPRYNARQARLVIEESILWPAIIDAPGRYGGTRLFWASWSGKLLRVETLIKWGADVNKADSHGMTPLMDASDKGHADIA